MAGNSNQKMKLLRLWDILRDCSDEEHPISATEICSKLSAYGISAERKSIYNDIEILRLYGLDIINTRTPRPGYFLAQRDFEVPEIQLMADAVQAAKFITPKKTRQLLSKLESKLSREQSKDLHRGVYIDNRNKCDNEAIYRNIDTIHRAIVTGQKITVTYSRLILPKEGKAIESTREHEISPYALTWVNDNYYLVGNNAKYDNLIHLRVDKIKKVVEHGEKSRHFSEVSEYKTFFDTADYTRKSFNMFGGEQVVIELRCDDRLIEWMCDQFGRDIYIRDRSDGKFTFSAKAYLSEGLVGWIMQYGNEIKVLSPAVLVEKVKQISASTAKLYD